MPISWYLICLRTLKQDLNNDRKCYKGVQSANEAIKGLHTILSSKSETFCFLFEVVYFRFKVYVVLFVYQEITEL